MGTAKPWFVALVVPAKGGLGRPSHGVWLGTFRWQHGSRWCAEVPRDQCPVARSMD